MNDASYLYDENAERGICAGVIVGGLRTLDRIGHDLRPDHFFIRKYQCIYAAAFDLYTAGTDINLITLTQALRESGDLDVIGGAAEITGLMIEGSAAHSVNEMLARPIIERHERRRAHDVITWAGSAIKEDGESFIEEFQRRVFALDEQRQEENLLDEAVSALTEEIARHERGERLTGLGTGVPSWDTCFGGLLPGRLYALGARPGRGKSAMAEQITTTLLAAGHAVLWFSLDMGAEALLRRMACRSAGVPIQKYERGYASKAELADFRRALNELKQAKLIVQAPPRLTGEALRSAVRREQRRNNIKAVFLDHYQLMHTGKDLREGLTKASIQIRGSATETGVSHCVLCHLNRGAKDQQRPSANDIKEADQLFGDSDGVALLWSKQEHFENNRLEVNFTVAKNRGGAICEDTMSFYGPTMRFDKISKA